MGQKSHPRGLKCAKNYRNCRKKGQKNFSQSQILGQFCQRRSYISIQWTWKWDIINNPVTVTDGTLKMSHPLRFWMAQKFQLYLADCFQIWQSRRSQHLLGRYERKKNCCQNFLARIKLLEVFRNGWDNFFSKIELNFNFFFKNCQTSFVIQNVTQKGQWNETGAKMQKNHSSMAISNLSHPLR